MPPVIARVVSVSCLVLLAGCPKDPPATVTTTDAGPISATPRDAGVDAAPADAGVKAAAKALDTDQRKTLLKALNDGRKKSRTKDYAGALADFDKALAIAPDDARVLAEVGWAALQAGDLPRAAKANKRALAHVRDDKLRAQILYNAGRVAEANKDQEAARKAYAESLDRRENGEVRRRLAAVGGTPPEAMPCAEGGPTPEAVCTCLLKNKDDIMSIEQTYACAPTAASLTLGTPRLSVIRWGAGEGSPGERRYVLTARDGGTMRPVAELGSDFEPGAFGVHNEAHVLGGEMRTIGKRSVAVVKSKQDDLDTNMAGLEACTHVEDRETVCALGEGDRATRCVTVPVSTESGCGPGVETDDLDEDTKATLADMKKGWGKTTRTLTWSIDDDGSLVVREATGAKAITSKHRLF